MFWPSYGYTYKREPPLASAARVYRRSRRLVGAGLRRESSVGGDDTDRRDWDVDRHDLDGDLDLDLGAAAADARSAVTRGDALVHSVHRFSASIGDLADDDRYADMDDDQDDDQDD